MGMLVYCSADITSPDKEASNTPSNNPEWKNTYLQRAESAYHSTKLHPSVVMFSLAYKAQNGICLYESYLAM
jgi:beta-galactosidase/beta-glucuronidase